MTVAYLGIGSNVGDRADFCRRAVEVLRATRGIDVVAVSSLYETTPVGGPPQRSYVNLAVKIETSLTARELLETCKDIERRLGRGRSEIRWGPRIVDLDILVFGDTKIAEPDLEVPHPRLSQRRFALVPLLEIEPGIADPWGARYADGLDLAEGDVRLLDQL